MKLDDYIKDALKTNDSALVATFRITPEGDGRFEMARGGMNLLPTMTFSILKSLAGKEGLSVAELCRIFTEMDDKLRKRRALK